MVGGVVECMVGMAGEIGRSPSLIYPQGPSLLAG
jgi:hypothetical protein